MAFPTMDEISWKFTGQPYDLNSALTPDQVWAKLDLGAEEVRAALNAVAVILNAVTDGSSGADNLAMTPISAIGIQASVQSIIEALITRLQAVTAGASGAKFVGVETIAGLTGNDVQTLLIALKTYSDNYNTIQDNALGAHKTSSDHDSKYYTKTEMDPYLSGGDTIRLYDVYTIVNSNAGDGTFTYQDKNSAVQTGEITAEGYQSFALQSGSYQVGSNMIDATINDTLRRSVASGGLAEIDSTHVALTVPEGAGAEITIEYFQRLGVTGTGLIVVSPIQPPSGFVWFKVVG